MRLALGASGLLEDARPDEFCLVVVPSKRLKSGRFALLLQENNISCRALGHGDGKVCDHRGVESKVRGILVLAILRKDAKRVGLFARLFGVTAVPVLHTHSDSNSG
jgi:hypothetical protein